MSEQAHIELVRTLFDTWLPTCVMSALYAGVAVLAVEETGDLVLLSLGLIGTVLSALRLRIVLLGRRDIDRRIVDGVSARAEERRFAISYVAFAVALGLFGARAMTLPSVELHMLVAALLVGYAAGVAVGISLRPRIGSISMLVAVVPAAVIALVTLDIAHVALSVIMLSLLGGGLQSMFARYRSELDKIELRRVMSGMARQDYLTDLPNRLGLAEAYDVASSIEDSDCLLAVHCLDLDRFKTVNDRHGHRVGDELLRMVAHRLRENLSENDLAARIGGDEFIVLQRGMRDEEEAERLAGRLARHLGEPYQIDDRIIRIGASVGYVVSQCNEPFELLQIQADNALYAIKAIGGGAAAHSETRIDKSIVWH